MQQTANVWSLDISFVGLSVVGKHCFLCDNSDQKHYYSHKECVFLMAIYSGSALSEDMRLDSDSHQWLWSAVNRDIQSISDIVWVNTWQIRVRHEMPVSSPSVVMQTYWCGSQEWNSSQQSSHSFIVCVKRCLSSNGLHAIIQLLWSEFIILLCSNKLLEYG